MPTSITCHIFGRKLTFVRDFLYLFRTPSAVERTLDLIRSRIDTIRRWGYHYNASALEKHMPLAENSPEHRVALFELALDVMTSPFSELDKREALLKDFENGNSQLLNELEILKASKEDVAVGLQKAVRIEEEKEKIIQSQLETLFLHQEYGSRTNELHHFMLDRGVRIDLDFTGRDKNDGYIIANELEPFSGTHFYLYLINNEGPPSSLQTWHAVYLWRKLVNGAHYSAYNEEREFDEVVIHAQVLLILDLNFLFSNRDEIALADKDSRYIYEKMLQVKEELEQNIEQLNRKYGADLAFPPDLSFPFGH